MTEIRNEGESRLVPMCESGPADPPDGAFIEGMGLFGKSPAFKSVLCRIPAAARGTAPILIVGEQGTCKERVARAVHYSSQLAGGPFLAVDCASLPRRLGETELFGNGRRGLIEASEGGTLFLDDISELAISVQARLAHFLETGCVSGRECASHRKVATRIIASVCPEMDRLVAMGLLRSDLLQRTATMRLDLPPLRARSEDIAPLAHWFVEKLAAEYGSKPPLLEAAAISVLQHYQWPGNVRELEILLRQLVLKHPSQSIGPSDVQSQMSSIAATSPDSECSLAQAELVHIRNVLGKVKGNKTHAARILGIDRKTLRQKLRQPEEHAVCSRG